MSDKIIRPKVTLVSEVTVDGKLTITRGASSKLLMQFMSHEAEILLHQIRAASDAIMVGANTIRIDNSFLTVRYVDGKNPIRVIPSSLGNLPDDSNIFSPDAKTIIAVSEKAPVSNREKIINKGAIVEVCGKEKVDLSGFMNLLYIKYSVKDLMIEGGSTLNGHMFCEDLIDKMILIHLPFIAGGENTPSLVTGLHPASVDEMKKLELKKHYMAGENLISEWIIKR